MTTVRVELLGPLRLAVDGRPVEVPGPKRRAVLALLAAAEGRVVHADGLLDALWPEEPPESGRAALQSHVSRLRGHLGPAGSRLVSTGGGYRLALEEAELDVAQARSLLRQARETTAAAVDHLRAASALWRGPVLAEFADFPPLAATAIAYDQLRRDVIELLVGCSIRSGRLDDVVDLATAMLAEDPLREPAVVLVVRALAATGDAARALAVAREYRSRLADETGLDPSPALGELERAVAAGELVAPVPGNAAPARSARPLFGRDAQLAALERLLGDERLVTIVGPGGVGKTRVALELARRAGGARVLPLAPVTDPSAVPHALAAALDLQVVTGDVLGACAAVLGTTRTLLVVDNCEHLLDTVRDTVERLLGGCPGLTVLATSREPLGVPGETPSRLAPLPLPGPDHASTAQVPSVALFLDRAARSRPGFSPGGEELKLVADVVRRLDGMPLAIELAAGRLAGLALPDLAARLDRALDLLGARTGDARHRTLRATVEWSYDLLPAEEQRLFRHLAVFVDGVDLPTAEAVAADLGLTGDPAAALAHLVDASMVEVSFSDRPRYRMLETLRAFGVDRLAAAGEAAAADDRLLRWAVELITWADATAATDREPDADAALRRELPNLRAAWRLARRRAALDDAVTMVVALHELSVWRDLVEVRGWADELVDDPALVAHPCVAAVLGTAARGAYIRGDHARAERLARDGLARAADAQGRWFCLDALANAALSRGAFAEVIEHKRAAAEHAARPDGGLGVAALAAAYAGDLAQARELHAALVAQGPLPPTVHAFGDYVAGEIENAAGRAEHAEVHYLDAIAGARASGATFVVGIASVGLVTVRAAAGRTADALRGYRGIVEYFAQAGNWTQLWVTLRNLAALLRELGDEEPAVLLDAAADQAPDAPPAARPSRLVSGPAIGRREALEVARAALHRHLEA
ncbi:putative ATPase [Pseudonocardia hierapolitana]|uniref:Putative ATPase n=1 Tax=Pseudonocardia hierapolitana TaxID=1128676 RepID=A0A561SLZ6_9PSEU|nr:BTAD domain-containing putative transcriptional regulator [Pseudonocardia hierapolitana]TWF75887.1 putative ATPase [Pseudonocardia hierapolitana]